ncbi:MAG: ZIP family metal transporter [Clostridiales bacterium]|nr:ZIP family metal transporter [Clostridiales bacterium]
MNDGDVLFGLLIPFAGTILGSALVFVISDKISDSFRNILTGMAGGIMLACAIWSLLTPTIVSGRLLTAFIGFLIGIGFQYALDKTVPHTHVFTDVEEGPSSKLGHIWKVVLSETIHHVPEGIAVGAMYAGVLTSTHEVTLAAAVALAVGIAIQNMPEGAFVSSPINAEGEQKSKSFLMGVVSGVVEPLLGIATIIVVGVFPGTLSFIMSLASGAIVFLVIEESIPSMFTGKYSDKGTLSLAVSFALMMLLTFIAGGSAL